MRVWHCMHLSWAYIYWDALACTLKQICFFMLVFVAICNIRHILPESLCKFMNKSMPYIFIKQANLYGNVGVVEI